MKDWAVVPLRLALGAVFIAHGLRKVLGLFGGPGIEGFAGMLEGLGFPHALVLAYIVSFLELSAGVCLIVGLLTKIVSLGIIGIMFVAIWKVHWVNGFFNSAGGYEYQIVIISACLSLLILGSGRLGVTKEI